MKKFKLFLGLAGLVVFTLSACSSDEPVDNIMSDSPVNNPANVEANSDVTAENVKEKVEEAMGEESAEMSESGHNNDQMEDTADGALAEDESSEAVQAEEPAWYTYQYTDAATGAPFRISDFKGKVVLVETLALWCSNCLRQQQQVKELHSLLGDRDDFVSVGINIDSREDLGMVANYVNNNGFDWLYGVAPDEIISDISATLGGQFLNPPSTPIVLIDKEGNQIPLPFGIKSANTLLSYVEEHLN